MLLEVSCNTLPVPRANPIGIGYAIVQHLLQSDLKPFVVGVSRSEETMSALAKEYPDRFTYVTGDLAHDDTAKAVVKKAVDEYGHIHGVVLNAGVLDPVDSIAQADVDAWRKLYDINVMSPLALASQAIPYLRITEGRLVFVSSGASVSNYQGWGAYGSSKAAINHIAATIHIEEPQLFSVSIAPGVVDTDMQVDIREKRELIPDILFQC